LGLHQAAGTSSALRDAVHAMFMASDDPLDAAFSQGHASMNAR
jgi:hypothetical protein